MIKILAGVTTVDHIDTHLLCKDFTSAHIRDVNFELRAGEILGVAGLADAGQSALLLALLGMDRRKSGTMTVRGLGKSRHGPAAAWRSKIAYIPRERRREGLMLRRSIIDNVALPHLRKFAALPGVQSARRERLHVDKLASDVALKSANLRQPAYQLSGGNQQKVMLARYQ